MTTEEYKFPLIRFMKELFEERKEEGGIEHYMEYMVREIGCPHPLERDKTFKV